MEDIPPEAISKLSIQQIKKMHELCQDIVRVFDDLDILDINNVSDKDMLVCVKKLDSIYYKNTGDEDDIGVNYLFKMRTLQKAFNECKDVVFEKNKSQFLETKELREEVLVEVCSKISYSIFIQSKGVDHAS